MILQQTRVNKVLPYFHRFTEAFRQSAILPRAKRESDVVWRGLGYYSRTGEPAQGGQGCGE